MRRLLFVLVIVALAGAALLLAARPAPLSASALPRHSPDLANGERLFHAGGCAACHATPNREQSNELGGGLELETPFGVFRVPNISPHPSRGIGTWKTLDFVNAMHRGVSPYGRHYYPSFPYPSYSRMRFEDLIDLKAYLGTLPPSDRHNDKHTLVFPWNIRAGVGLWKWFNLDPDFVVEVPANDELLARGRYLVEGVGHCGECHTPRNWLGGLKTNRWLAGAPSLDGEGAVPDITARGKPLAAWSRRDIVYYLESGLTPDYDTAGGAMAKVQKSLARLPGEDLEAIATYLKSATGSR